MSSRSIVISIVIPCYNERGAIEETISAVDELSLADAHEIIVVDDGSTDGSDALLVERAESDPHFKLLRHDTDTVDKPLLIGF